MAATTDLPRGRARHCKDETKVLGVNLRQIINSSFSLGDCYGRGERYAHIQLRNRSPCIYHVMQKLGSTVFLFISYILMHISCNMYYCPHTVTSCHYCSVWVLLLLTMLTISCFVCNHTLSLAWPQIHETSNFSLTQFCNYFKELAWSAAKMFSFWRRCNNPKSYLEIWSQVEARLCSRFLLTTSLLQA